MLHSPRLSQLQHDLTHGHEIALLDFWQTLKTEGTPLVEPVADAPGHVWVTFLWQATEPTSNVLVLSALVGMDWHKCQMTRLGETDLWYLTAKARRDARFGYVFSPNLSLAAYEEGRQKRQPLPTQLDPHNPHALPPEKPFESVVTLPDAPPQRWLDPASQAPHGMVTEHSFTSEMLGNTRTIGIYAPPGYTDANAPCSLLLLFDGDFYQQAAQVPRILDNLLAAGRIAPTVAVLIPHVDMETRVRELTCNADFARMLVEELLPWVRQNYRVTPDPARTVVGGLSLGGLSAAFAALRYPQVFGNVLSQSGSYWWMPEWEEPETEAEQCWLTRQYRDRERLPIRFYLDAGLLENGAPHGKISLLQANRHLRDVLLAKGYDVHYAEFSGDHAMTSWAITLPEGLLALRGKTMGGSFLV